MGRRVAVAIQAKTHAQRLRFVHFVHLVYAAMAFHAADATRNMHGMIEIGVFWHMMDLHPRYGFARCGAVPHDGQTWIILQNRAMAVHAGGSPRKIRKPRFFDTIVAIAAVEAQFARVYFMGKRDRLHRLVADAGIFRREIVPDASRRGTGAQCGTDA